MKFLLAAILAFAFILFPGCVTVSPPQSCASLSATEQPGCIYYSAVMAQDPYPCYSIADKTQRETCLRDAIDPAAKKALQRSSGNRPGGLLNGTVSGGLHAQLPSNSSSNQPQPPPMQENGSSTGGLGNSVPVQQNVTEAPPATQPASQPAENQSAQPSQPSNPPATPRIGGQGLAAG